MLNREGERCLIVRGELLKRKGKRCLIVRGRDA